ncbi:MAG: hypothetical protein Q8P42_16195 [Gallionella sp.]|nr:hypothetical protein [Gallionella sp.]
MAALNCSITTRQAREDNNSAPPEGGYLKLTEQEVMDSMTFGVKQGQAQAFEWVAENFLIATASLIRVGGLDPESAVNLGFHIAHSFQSAGCMVQEVEQKDYDPESRAARWLKGDKETLAEFAALAVEMQTLWHKK